MNKLREFILNKKLQRVDTPIEDESMKEEEQNVPSESMRSKGRPVVESPTEFDYELYKSNWVDLNDTHLDHLIEDMKSGNIKEGVQQDEVNHYLNCATMCSTWHHNPKHKLIRSKAMFVSDAARVLGVSMSVNAKFFDGVRTVRQKKQERRGWDKKDGSLVPFGKKKEDEDKWWD